MTCFGLFASEASFIVISDALTKFVSSLSNNDYYVIYCELNGTGKIVELPELSSAFFTQIPIKQNNNSKL